MQRFVALIVLVFAFASVVGTMTAHAHRYVSTPIVVLNLVDDDNRAIPVVVQVQRGQIDLGAGLMMPCGSHHAIPVEHADLPSIRACDRPIASLDAPLPVWPEPVPLRPPKAA